MNDPTVDALPPAEADPPAPIDETAGPAVVDPDDDHPGRRGVRGRIGSIGWRYTLVVFAVEVAFFSITAGDRFLTTTNLILTAQNVAVLTVVACGSTFVLITAGVDLSVGSVAILGEVLAAKTIVAVGGAASSTPASAWPPAWPSACSSASSTGSASPTSRCRRSSSPCPPC